MHHHTRPNPWAACLLVATLLSVVAFGPSATPLARAATITVSNLADSGAGSLRAAIAEAASGDTITFQEGLSGTIPLASELAIGKSITIAGPPLVAGTPAITLDGQNSVRVLQLGSTETGPITIEINNLAISRGLAAVGSNFGGGIRQSSLQVTSVFSNCEVRDSVAGAASGSGGGIQLTGGSMTINSCRLSGNRAPAASGSGGAINNEATLTINDSTISGNSAVGSGGGISNVGVLTINRSTLSGNTTNAQGGALVNGGGGPSTSSASLNNCTISGNAAVGSGFVPAIKNFAASNKTASVTLTNCTIANNTTDSIENSGSIDNATTGGTATVSYRNTIFSTTSTKRNIFNGPGATLVSNGYNLCSDDSCNLTAVGDRPNTPAGLSATLANRGGSTETLLPLPGSGAIDGGAAVAGIATDQRGVPRPADLDGLANAAGGDGSDIGAVEVRPPTITAGGAVTVQQGGATSGSIPIASATNPDGALNELTVEQTGGTASGVTLEALASSNGNVTATLTASAAATSGTVVLRVLNAYGASASATLDVVVGPALAFTSQNATTFTLGTPNSFTFTTNGQSAPTISLTSGSLPPGVTLNQATGALVGTPAPGSTGSYPLVFTASGSSGSATQNFTLTVREIRIYLPVITQP